MSLEEFDRAEGQEGFLYELSRGEVTVVDVPGGKHFAQLDEVREQLSAYRSTHRNHIYRLGHGSDCKILLTDLVSERHADLSIYLTPPVNMKNIWLHWIPEIVIEIVSRSSHHRDYVEKREEYLQFGVQEYWIIDADPEEMLVLQRSDGQWIENVARANETYRTRLLPDFELVLKPIFDAARAAE